MTDGASHADRLHSLQRREVQDDDPRIDLVGEAIERDIGAADKSDLALERFDEHLVTQTLLSGDRFGRRQIPVFL